MTARPRVEFDWVFRVNVSMSFRFTLVLVLAALGGCAAVTQDDARRAPQRPQASQTIAGVWVITVESSMGRDAMQTRFEQSGERLSGVMKTAGAEVPLQGNVAGEVIRFDMSLEVRGQPLKLEYAGTVRGDEMSGTVQFGPMGTGNFSGVRSAPP
jgi:hypothetical protein